MAIVFHYDNAFAKLSTHDNQLFLSAFPICRPTRTRTQTNSFGDCYATITPSTYIWFCGKAGFRPQSGKPNDLLSRQSRLLDSCSFQFEQIKGIEPSSPVWQTGALAVVLYLQKNCGCNIGFEPMTFWTTIRRSNQLN